MKKNALLLVVSLVFILSSVAPAAAQWFHRIGHVSKSKTKKSEHSNKSIKYGEKHKTNKRKPDHDERRRRREAKRQEKRRAEGPRPQQAAPEPQAAPKSEKTTP